MKYAIHLTLLVLMGAMVSARAVPFTTYLDELSNTVAQAHANSADSPQVQKWLGKALADFEKPSTSVAGDYDIFIAVASHLIPLERISGAEEMAGQFGTLSSNVFTNFVIAAQMGLLEATDRIAALSDFQRHKRPAGNQLRQAERAFQTLFTTSNIQIGMLSLRLAFVKIALANKLAAKGEAKPGFAPEGVIGETLTHSTSQQTRSMTFTDDSNFTAGEDTGTYTYTRTGLNTGRLNLVTELENTTMNLTFKSSEGGAFSVVSVTPLGTFRAKGTFSLAD